MRRGSRWLMLLASLALVLAEGREASAERGFEQLIPNGTLNESSNKGDGCGNCHVPNSNSRNDFGNRWKTLRWGAQLAGEHSDGDGITNGWELGDPQGAWRPGDPAPGNPALVTSPGQTGSAPPVLSVSPMEIDHFEAQGENGWQSFAVENVGGDCFGNPMSPCTLSMEVSTAEAWMAFDPETGELAPGEIATVDVLFTTDGLTGDFDGSAFVSASGVSNSPQEVLVTLTVPEPGAGALVAAALLTLASIAGRTSKRS